jgi:integrase
MLSDVSIRKAKPALKPVKLFDERGLYLLVTPAGGKLWRLKYRFDRKEKLLAFGAYPDVSLAEARNRREAARKLLAAGVDPARQRRAERVAITETFEAIASEWLDKFAPSLAPVTVRKIRERLVRHILPHLGSNPVREIDAAALLAVLRRVEENGTKETAHRLLRICGQILRYAVSTGRADHDPSRDLRGALAPVQVEHRAAVTDPKKLAGLLCVLDGYEGSLIVRCALRLAPLVFVRPGELRKAEWSEIDLDGAQWTIPAWRMKMRQTLTVPLSRQGVAIFRELQPVTGDGKYVFPSGRSSSRPMSDNAVLAAMRRCGIPKEEMTGHGFRATARTILDEVLHFRVDLIEHQLGHAVKDPNGRAYNRTSFLAERTEMMQAWSDYLDNLKAGGREAPWSMEG